MIVILILILLIITLFLAGIRSRKWHFWNQLCRGLIVVFAIGYFSYSFISPFSENPIGKLKYENVKFSIWVTLDLLLIFLNLVLLFRAKRK